MSDRLEEVIRHSFEIAPPPQRSENLALFELYSADEMRRIRAGFLTRDMDDRWFLYFERGWLHLHHSRTGHHILALHFDEALDGSATL